MIIHGAVLFMKTPFPFFLCDTMSIHKWPFFPCSVFLNRFPIAAYNIYAFLSRFEETVYPSAAIAKNCGISPLILTSCAQLAQVKLAHFKNWTLLLFILKSIKDFPSTSVNDSGGDDRHRKQMLFETIRDRFE
jgi:hypothetical protein